MFYILFEFDFFGQIVHRTVNFYPCKPAFSVPFELFAVFALSAPYDRSVYEYTTARFHSGNFIGNLVDGYFFDNSAALRTMRDAYSRV